MDFLLLAVVGGLGGLTAAALSREALSGVFGFVLVLMSCYLLTARGSAS